MTDTSTSSLPVVLCEKSTFLKFFHKIHRKTPVSENFLIMSEPETCDVIKIETQNGYFSANFAKFLNTFFTEHL